MFIIDINYTAPLEEVDQYIEGHTAYLKKYVGNNTFIVTGRKVPLGGNFRAAARRSSISWSL